MSLLNVWDGSAWVPITTGVGDHGGLSGLADDDHTQYILADASRAFSGEIDAQAGMDISGGTLKIGGSTVIDASENVSFAGTGTSQQIGGAGAKVGIGESAPETMLHVKGTLDPVAIFEKDADDDVAIEFRGSFTPVSFFTGTINDKFFIGTGHSTARLSMDTSGLVGVNQVSPSAQLHVVSGAAGRIGLVADTAASPSQPAIQVLHNGSTAVNFFDGGSRANPVFIAAFDNDAGIGNRLFIDRNNDGATPAAGHIGMRDKGNAAYLVWPDDSGDLRIGTTDPTNANDGSGIVVGDQSSWHEGKNILGPALPAQDAVRDVAALAFEQFEYKETGYQQWDGSPPRFNGLVIRDRVNDWWGKNMGPGQTPALNEVELFARYGLTIQSLIAEVQALGGFAWL